MSDIRPIFSLAEFPFLFASEKHCFTHCEHLTEPWEEAAGALLIGVFLNVSIHNNSTRLTYEWILMSLCGFLLSKESSIAMQTGNYSVVLTFFPSFLEACLCFTDPSSFTCNL